MSSSLPCNIPYVLSLIGKNVISKANLADIDFNSVFGEGKPIPLPQYKILDVGCGYGKWGFLIRDTFEVMLGQNFNKSDWQIQIDGIEVFPDCITKIQTELYNNIFQKDVFDMLEELGSYDLIMFGDMIEHLEKEKGHMLLTELFKHSDNIIVSTPLGFLPQGPWAGNKFEVHKSGWNLEDFERYTVVEHKIIKDDTFQDILKDLKNVPDTIKDSNLQLLVLWLKKKQ